MESRAGIRGAIFFFLLVFIACGNLRYSQLAPESVNFHPHRVGVLPVEAFPYGEAKYSVDRIIAEVLADKKWFTSVVGGEMIDKQNKSSEEFAKVKTAYLAKLKLVHFSDPEMSRQIGHIYDIDAFLVVDIDYWNYTVVNDDKIAKVGLTMKMVEASTGIVMWNATHSIEETYVIFKPDLSDLVKTLIKQMVRRMPH